MLTLTVDEALPGTTLERRAGDTLSIAVQAWGHATDVPLQDVELVVHGEVVRTVTPTDAGQSSDRLQLTHQLPLGAHGVWIAARARGGPTQAAHTTPVYVRVNGSGFENPATARHYLDLSEAYLQEIEAELANPGTAVNNQLSRYREGIEKRITETRVVLQELAERRR